MHTINHTCIHTNGFIDLRLIVCSMTILSATPLPSLMCDWYPYVSLGAGAVCARACGSATASCGGYQL